MPPSPAQLQGWWLSAGWEQLCAIFDSDDGPSPNQVGFAQAAQRKLRAFDHDVALHDCFRDDWNRTHEEGLFAVEANPRQRLLRTTQEIFRPSNHGGLDYSRAMEGLGDLDAAEVHRLTLMNSFQVALDEGSGGQKSSLLVNELYTASTKRYAELHLGFRALILIHYLDPEEDTCSDPIKAMALVNALFPPVIHLEDADDFDVCPYTIGLRGSIRLTLFEHLLGETPFAQEKFDAIKLKIMSYNKIPGYGDLRLGLVRYNEEVKKLEGSGFKMLDTAEKLEQKTASDDSATGKARQGVYVTSPTTTLNSGYLRPVSSAPPVPHPLIQGMPGREIFGAHTDPAAFIGSTFGQRYGPVECGALSKTEFHEHPIAKYTEFSSAEKAAIGLLLPRVVDYTDSEDEGANIRSVTLGKKATKASHRKKSSSLKERGKGRLTSITEEPSFVKNFFQKHVVKRVASKPYLRSSTSPEPKQKGTGRGAASLPPPSKGKGKDVMKAHISAPDMKVRRSSSGASKLSNEIKLDSPTTPTLKYDPARYSTVPNTTIKRTSEARNEKFVLAEARMAPMEYARKFLIEKANAHKENRDCSLPPFLYSYYWAPKYERWFLTPKLPESIKRAYGTRIYRSNDVERSTAETNAVDLEQIMGNPDCPRLSLHLGQIESLLPSMTAMDLNDVDKHVYDKKSHKDAHEDTKYMMSGALGGADTSARLHEGTYPVSSATDDQKQSRHKHVKSASEGTNVTSFTQCFDEAVRAYGGSEHGESAVIYEQYANTPEASVHKETAEASVDEGIAEASEKNDDKDSFKDSQYSDDTITAFRKITEHQNRAWLTPRKEADAEGTPPSTTAKDGSSPVDGTGLDGSSPVSNWPLQPGRSRRADHGRNLFETAGGLRSYNNMHHPVLMPSASEASQRSVRAELEPRPLRVPSNTPKPASRLSPQPGSLLYEMEEKACRESFELYHRPRQLRDEPGPADNSNTLPGCNNPFATQSTTERLRLAATEAAQDKVAPEAYEESDDNGSDCDLVETMTKHNVRSDTMLLQETGRPKHIPIVLDQSRSLRSDMTTQERLAQPPRSTWSHSPSSNEERGSASRFGSLFRRKNREKSAKTPTTPSYWSPFDRHSPSPPHTKVWGEQGSPSSDKKQERANWFRSKAEQAAKSHRNRTFSGAQRSQEEVEPPTKRESPVDIQGTLDQAPVPPPSHSAFDDPRSPPAPKLPPIPPLPTDYTPTRPFAEYATNMDEADLVPFREKSARALAARAKKSSDGLKSKSSTGLRNTFLKGGSWRKGKDKDEGKGN